jgi:uncharacterized protein (DUF2336 family)
MLGTNKKQKDSASQLGLEENIRIVEEAEGASSDPLVVERVVRRFGSDRRSSAFVDV